MNAADMLDTVGPGQMLLADCASAGNGLRQALVECGATANIKPLRHRLSPAPFSPSADCARASELVDRWRRIMCRKCDHLGDSIAAAAKRWTAEGLEAYATAALLDLAGTPADLRSSTISQIRSILQRVEAPAASVFA